MAQAPPSRSRVQNASLATGTARQMRLDLSRLPPIFVSRTHFEDEDLHELEDDLTEAGATLTWDLNEARIVLSRVTKKARIQFDLRAKGLWTKEIEVPTRLVKEQLPLPKSRPVTKRRKVDQVEAVGNDEGEAIVIDDDESTASETEDCARVQPEESKSSRKQNVKATAPPVRTPSPRLAAEQAIEVLKIRWFEDSKKAGRVLPLKEYLTYEGLRTSRPEGEVTPKSVPRTQQTKPITAPSYGYKTQKPDISSQILERAKEDFPAATSSKYDRFHKRAPAPSTASWSAGHGHENIQYAHLLHMTTSEYDSGASSDVPEMPDWVKAGVKYSCQRSTPKSSPNDPFISLLKKIKLARLLTNDEIGVRAYSTSIASLAAYPYKISNPREILALPGCDAKIANLYVEYANTGGRIQAVEDIKGDADLNVLRLFYEVWGVGATTARDFYYDRGWRDLDDIVEYGWSTLSRVQQIGVKYYDQFLDPIPRAEVEEIARIVHRHAVNARDEGVQSLIVGGYRRGKEACGDVDMIVSHPDEAQTLNIVNDIVASLEREGWITHTLLLSLHSTNRGQQTLPFKGGSNTGGHGFDTLDKALVVWQDPSWRTKEADLAADPKAKNPNIHRRVDIIISPWRTVGCAVAGWSGGTTFQRDLRRYAKAVKGWKFDSSGIRSRGNGQVVDVEGYHGYEGKVGKGRARRMEEAERRVFEGLGLVFREPWERCTG